jgi:type VI secretion system protein ImpM
MAFWNRKKPQPPVVSCFGKLPATGDFIRYQAASAESTAFNDWLQPAIALAKQQIPDGFEAVYRPNVGLFIYRGPDGDGNDEPDRGMVGVWAASGDKAGRHYPMVIATSYDYAEMLAVGPGLPIALWPFLTAAYDLVANGRGLQPDDFVARVAQIQPLSLANANAASAGYREWLQFQTMRALWETGFGGVEPRHAVVQSLLASVEIFRGRERPQTSLALRLPLGSGDAYAVAVWTDMTLRLAGWERTVLNAFWSPRRDLLLHLGAPHVGTFRELIASTRDADHVMDLVAPPSIEPAAARAKLAPGLAEAVDKADLSISAFLQRI